MAVAAPYRAQTQREDSYEYSALCGRQRHLRRVVLDRPGDFSSRTGAPAALIGGDAHSCVHVARLHRVERYVICRRQLKGGRHMFLPPSSFVQKTGCYVVIYHANTLHVGVYGGRAYKAESSLFHISTYLLCFISVCGYIPHPLV